jgi:glycosyltransferase involved in cell wall biosynthesis
MFSVVIPLYNKEHTIVNTLECVLNQTFKEFEVIIVDDGSTDASVDVIRNFTRDSKIRIVQQENQGVSGARNTGVDNAKYQHIAFLDGDDEWFPEYLQKMKEAINKFPESEFFCSSGMSKNGKGEYKPREIEKYKEQVLAFEFFENPHVFLHISAIVVTKKLFQKVGGFPLGMKRNEDFTFLYSAALFSEPIYSGHALSVYVSGVAGQATNSSIYDDQKLLRDVVTRYNIVFNNWKKLGGNNKAFIVFMKYELRHSLMMNSMKGEYKTNLYFLENLNKLIINKFSVI